MFEQLSDQDAGYLYLETLETPQHVGGVSLVDLPPGYEGDFFADYRRQIADRLHLIPLLHRKLAPLPFDIDHPFWIDEPHVDLDYHIRLQTLPPPGRMAQLEELVGRLHSNFLDRTRPLWEFYVINGLASGQVAIYTKIHHAGMDGASSQHLVETMYDPTPEPRQFARPVPPPAAEGAPRMEKLLRGVTEHVVRSEIRALQFVPELLKAWSRIALPDARTLRYDTASLPPLRPPKTLFNVAISSQRAYAARSLSLKRCKALARAADCKVNDIVLALCADVLRRYLHERDALPRQPMTAMVPVATRDPNAAPGAANQNALMLCSLATHIADPVKRLQAIAASSQEQKKLLGNLRNLLLPDLSLVGSGLVMRGMVDLYRRAKLADQLPPFANLTVSNVPGPPVPLYIAGARVASFYPCSIPYHGTALNITVESYCDALDFGLIACRRTVPDVAELADNLTAALETLEAALLTAPPAVAGEALPATPAKKAKKAKKVAKAAAPSAETSPPPTKARTKAKTKPPPAAKGKAAVKPVAKAAEGPKPGTRPQPKAQAGSPAKTAPTAQAAAKAASKGGPASKSAAASASPPAEPATKRKRAAAPTPPQRPTGNTTAPEPPAKAARRAAPSRSRAPAAPPATPTRPDAATARTRAALTPLAAGRARRQGKGAA